MRQLILHIGQYKTGSTSIQKTLDRARDRLAAHGILYPATGCRKGQHGDLTRLLKREARFGADIAPFDGAPLMAELREARSERVVISCEGMSGAALSRMEPEVIRHVLRRVGDVFDGWKIDVVWYYRRQDEAIESRMIQAVKGRAGAIGFDMRPYLRMGEALDYPFFHSIVAEALPGARIVPRCFSRALLHGGDVVRDFCAVSGLDDTLRPQDMLQGNVSPTGASVGLQLALNLLAEAGNDVDPIMRSARRMTRGPSSGEGTGDAGRAGTKATVLNPQMRRQAMTFFAEANARFVAQHVPEQDRAAVTACFAAPVAERTPNVTVSAETLARAIVQAGAAISFEGALPRQQRNEGVH